MYRQHVSPQTQNKRTSSLICGAKRRTGARIATFGLSVLVAGQLMLPGVALSDAIGYLLGFGPEALLRRFRTSLPASA